MKPKSKIISHKTRIALIKLILAVVAVLLLILPIASTRPQVDMNVLVTAIGLDYAEEGVKCTVEIILPVENNGATGESVVLDGVGNTLSTALENLSIAIGRRLDLNHCALVVIGKEKAEHGVMDELEFLLSSGKVSPEIGLMLADNKDANEFITKLAKYAKKMDVDSLLRYTDFGAHNYSQGLVHFLYEINSKSKSSIMPCIKMGDKAENLRAIEDGLLPDSTEKSEKEDEQGIAEGEGGKAAAEDNGGDNSGGGGEEGGEKEEKPTVVQRTEKIAAFYEGKLRVVWESAESNGLAWGDRESKHGIILLKDIRIQDNTIDKMSCFLIKKKVKTRAKFENGVPVFSIRIQAHFQVEERNKIYEAMGPVEGDKSKIIYPVIIEEMEKYISKSILEVLKKSIEDKCDALLIHDEFYRYDKKNYERFIGEKRDLLKECALAIKYDIKMN